MISWFVKWDKIILGCWFKGHMRQLALFNLIHSIRILIGLSSSAILWFCWSRWDCLRISHLFKNSIKPLETIQKWNLNPTFTWINMWSTIRGAPSFYKTEQFGYSHTSGQSRATSGQNTLPDTNFANVSQLRNRFVCCLKIIFHKILDSNIFYNLLPSTVVDCNFRAKAWLSKTSAFWPAGIPRTVAASIPSFSFHIALWTNTFWFELFHNSTEFWMKLNFWA